MLTPSEEEERPIGSRAIIDGVEKLWAGPDLGYQTEETYQKLETEGYDGDPDYLLKGGWGARRVQKGIIEPAIETVAETVAPIAPYAAATYETLTTPLQRQVIKTGFQGLGWTVDKLSDLTSGASRAMGIHPFWGELGFDIAGEVLTPPGAYLATKYIGKTAGKTARMLAKTELPEHIASATRNLPGYETVRDASRLFGGSMETAGSVGAAGSKLLKVDDEAQGILTTAGLKLGDEVIRLDEQINTFGRVRRASPEAKSIRLLKEEKFGISRAQASLETLLADIGDPQDLRLINDLDKALSGNPANLIEQLQKIEKNHFDRVSAPLKMPGWTVEAHHKRWLKLLHQVVASGKVSPARRIEALHILYNEFGRRLGNVPNNLDAFFGRAVHKLAHSGNFDHNKSVFGMEMLNRINALGRDASAQDIAKLMSKISTQTEKLSFKALTSRENLEGGYAALRGSLDRMSPSQQQLFSEIVPSDLLSTPELSNEMRLTLDALIKQQNKWLGKK